MEKMKKLIVALLLPTLASLARANDPKRSIQIMNESGRRVDIHWIHPDTGEMVLQSSPDILHGASMDLNSFVGHTFQVKELPAKKTGVCAGADREGSGECGVDHFTVNPNVDQVIKIKEGIQVEHVDSKTIANNKASELLDACRSTARRELAKNKDSNVEASTAILEDLSTCVQEGIANEIETANEEIQFQTGIRESMVDSWEDYTCADPKANATEPTKDATRWKKGRKVSIMLDRPTAKIHVVENFLSAKECAAVEEAARPRLRDAVAGDEDVVGVLSSDPRNVKVADIEVDWGEEKKGNRIAQLSRRVYDYINHVLPFDAREQGQENPVWIQHSAREDGDDDRVPDRYASPCEGGCDGSEFESGGLAAAMFMYCEVPKKGGATNFRNAGVHIKPTQYSATFVSYADPEKMIMDTGFAEHSGCPVVEGEKKILTQWVRLWKDDTNP